MNDTGQHADEVEVVRVGRDELPQFQQLLRDIAADSQPHNPKAADQKEAGLERALESFDFLASDSFWILVGKLNGKFEGYAAVARIPKAGALIGTLYIDELYIRRASRRRGVGIALLREVIGLGRELSGWRVRLIVGPDEEAARQLYRSVGFRQGNGLFCELDS